MPESHRRPRPGHQVPRSAKTHAAKRRCPRDACVRHHLVGSHGAVDHLIRRGRRRTRWPARVDGARMPGAANIRRARARPALCPRRPGRAAAARGWTPGGRPRRASPCCVLWRPQPQAPPRVDHPDPMTWSAAQRSTALAAGRRGGSIHRCENTGRHTGSVCERLLVAGPDEGSPYRLLRPVTCLVTAAFLR